MAYMEKMAEQPHSRRCRQLPSRGAEKPLIEERCHEVKEWCMAYMEKMAEPPHSRRCRQLPSRGAEKPLLEERCHGVTEWWQPYTLISK